MATFIHPLSVIRYSKVLLPPTPEEVVGLTPDSVWGWFVHCLGWHEPVLSEVSKRIVRKRFESIPLRLRRFLIRPDLLPHRHFPPDAFRADEPDILAFYRLTAAIRGLAVRSAHRLYRNASLNRVGRYSGHQLWVPEAELNWLRMRDGMRQAAEGKLIDFPVSLNFITAALRPQHNPLIIQIKKMHLDTVPGDGYWPVEFYRGSASDYENPVGIGFHTNSIENALGFDLPQLVGKIGTAWIENLVWGPGNRVLFKKTCSEDIGILLWPLLPDKSQVTPRVPVYEKDIIELVEGDRLLIFPGPKRGLEDAMIQIEITARWASTLDLERTYADKKFVYPNPCERYPYCLKRPIYRPTLDPIILQHQLTPKSEYTPYQTDQTEEDNSHPTCWPPSPNQSFDQSVVLELPPVDKQDPKDSYSVEIIVEVLDEVDGATINDDDEAPAASAPVVPTLVESPEIHSPRPTPAKRKRSDEELDSDHISNCTPSAASAPEVATSAESTEIMPSPRPPATKRKRGDEEPDSDHTSSKRTR